MPSLIAAASLVLALFAAIPFGYLLLLTLLSFARPAPAAGAPLELVCVVPAHDEELGIGDTVRSLLGAEYPAALRGVLVVADNCSDATAQRAREAGADVIERTDPDRRGKGYALELGFGHVLADPAVAGVLVCDADTLVAPNLWRAMSARLAIGEGAVQAANRVRNRDASWRTRLLAITLAMINGVRCLGRERLGLSVGLKGNGMAFSRRTLTDQPQHAFGLVEDLEYAIQLGRGGIRVAFAPETWIASESPVGARDAVSQRQRWEKGRFQLIRSVAPGLLAEGLGRRSAVLVDLAMELFILPLGYYAPVLGLGAILEALHRTVGGAWSIAAPVWIFAVVALGLHVARGIVVSGTGWAGVGALLRVPVYLVWKFASARPWRRTQEWTRTRRVREGDDQ